MNLKEWTLEIVAATTENSKILKHHVISDWVEQIDPILKESGEPCIGQDTVSILFLSNDWLYISTDDNTGGYSSGNDIRIPLSVIESDNPTLAARDYKVGKEIAELQQDISRTEQHLKNRRARLAVLTETRSRLRLT